MDGGIDRFSTYNPVINFLFFAGAVVFGMFFVHPAFLACSLLASSAYYITVRGMRGLRLIAGMIPLFIFMSAINPLFNTLGNTVLFRIFGGRAYTLEALCYGMALSAMFISVILWFASYSIVMTSDKFIYIFGRMIPSLAMILTMVLRFIPLYRKKAMQISSARMSIGMAGSFESRTGRIRDGMAVLSALTSLALEGGIITADSMRSRGYGCGRRTNFSIYRFDGRDMILTAVMLTLAATVIFCAARGAASAVYTPQISISPLNNIYSAAAAAAYLIFLSVPAVLNITEDIKWRILRSGI